MIPTMILLFVVGYLFIALEHKTRIDKSAVALLMAGADRKSTRLNSSH